MVSWHFVVVCDYDDEGDDDDLMVMVVVFTLHESYLEWPKPLQTL